MPVNEMNKSLPKRTEEPLEAFLMLLECGGFLRRKTLTNIKPHAFLARGFMFVRTVCRAQTVRSAGDSPPSVEDGSRLCLENPQPFEKG